MTSSIDRPSFAAAAPYTWTTLASRLTRSAKLYLCMTHNCHVRGQHSAAGQFVLLVTSHCSFGTQERRTHNAPRTTLLYLALHSICQAAIQRQHLHSHIPVQVPPLIYLPPTQQCNKRGE